MTTTGLVRCDGCKHNHYSAPGGQAGNRTPHSRCSALNADIKMILGEHQKWLGSAIPKECPTYPERAGKSLEQSQ